MSCQFRNVTLRHLEATVHFVAVTAIISLDLPLAFGCFPRLALREPVLRAICGGPNPMVTMTHSKGCLRVIGLLAILSNKTLQIIELGGSRAIRAVLIGILTMPEATALPLMKTALSTLMNPCRNTIGLLLAMSLRQCLLLLIFSFNFVFELQYSGEFELLPRSNIHILLIINDQNYKKY